MLVFKFLYVLILLLFIGCNSLTNSSVDGNSYSVIEEVDSIHIVLLLENNMDTISNSATVSYNGFDFIDLDEGIKINVSVPNDMLVVQWTTKHIRGNDNWPYVYWLELDGSGACDTTVVYTIYPVENSRYYIRGLEIRELF